MRVPEKADPCTVRGGQRREAVIGKFGIVHMAVRENDTNPLKGDGIGLFHLGKRGKIALILKV